MVAATMSAAEATMAANNAHQALEAATDRKTLENNGQPAPAPVAVTVVVTNQTTIIMPKSEPERVRYGLPPPQRDQQQITYQQPVQELVPQQVAYIESPTPFIIPDYCCDYCSSHVGYPALLLNFGIGNRYGYYDVSSRSRFNGGGSHIQYDGGGYSSGYSYFNDSHSGSAGIRAVYNAVGPLSNGGNWGGSGGNGGGHFGGHGH
jgi:hypothetical protein